VFGSTPAPPSRRVTKTTSPLESLAISSTVISRTDRAIGSISRPRPLAEPTAISAKPPLCKPISAG